MDGPAPDTEHSARSEPGGPTSGTTPSSTPNTGADDPVGTPSAGPTAPKAAKQSPPRGGEGADSALTEPPRFGLAVAALSVGAVGVVVALSTWAAWLLVRPELRDSASAYPWLAAVFQLVLGALWFAVLPAGALAIVFGLVAAARADGGVHLARAGAILGLLAVAIAVAGAAAFVFDPRSGTTPGSLGTYPRFFN